MADFLSSAPGDAGSLTVSTYRRLRTDVLTGRLAPSEKLKIHELATLLGVSPGVVREALSRLASERLVVATPQRGFRVAPISAEDVHDLTEARIEIEMACLKRSISRGDVAWETGIVAATHRLNRTAHDTSDPSEEWAQAHAAFHEALVAACDSKWLLAMREQLYYQAERYRRINIRVSGPARDLPGEHDNIAAAVLAKDLDRAAELMTAHLRLTETLTLKSLSVQAGAEYEQLMRHKEEQKQRSADALKRLNDLSQEMGEEL
jgi:GntR family transcriptional regulator, carbon starvation induced regulator